MSNEANTPQAGLRDYVALARPDHWFKNIFMLPGFVFALYFLKELPTPYLLNLFIGVVSTCLVASSNYVINEWLDRKYDRFHPVKKERASVRQELSQKVVLIEYFALAATGFGLGYLISTPFLLTSVALWVMGFLYNVEPFRTKDRTYLDVLSESVNNPLRLMLGWFIVTSSPLPPSSLSVGYWMSGAFLMALKRYAEYRSIDNPEQAGLYRRSFRFYNEEKLLISSFFYAMSSTLFLGVFLVKHRIEFILLFPMLAGLYAWYFHLAHQEDSIVQAPEKLYKEKAFMVYNVVFALAALALLFVEIPPLHWLLESMFNELSAGSSL